MSLADSFYTWWLSRSIKNGYPNRAELFLVWWILSHFEKEKKTRTADDLALGAAGDGWWLWRYKYVLDRRELHQAFLGEWDDAKKENFLRVKIKIKIMDKHLCCTFSWKIHDGGIRKLIVNSWEETYTQQNGSTVTILLSGKWGIVRCHVCQRASGWQSRHLLMGPSWFITIYWACSSPRRFGRWPLPFYSFTYHKSICSPSSVYQHRFSSKILKPNLLVNSPPLFGASQRCGSWWASEWCSSTSCAARVFCGRRTFQIGRCERTVMAKSGWASKSQNTHDTQPLQGIFQLVLVPLRRIWSKALVRKRQISSYRTYPDCSCSIPFRANVFFLFERRLCPSAVPENSTETHFWTSDLSYQKSRINSTLVAQYFCTVRRFFPLI